MEFEALREAHNGYRYRVPEDLRLNQTPLRKILLVGSCFTETLGGQFHRLSGCKVDFAMTNYTEEPPSLDRKMALEYDFQVGIPALRTVMPEGGYLPLAANDEKDWECFFIESQERLRQILKAQLRHNREHGLLSFVGNFMLPQQNALGRLFPTNSLNNPQYFIRRLNDTLAEELKNYKNAYLLDIDGIASSYGKKFIQDDMLWVFSHGTWIFDIDAPLDKDRIESLPGITEHYTLMGKGFLSALWAEVEGAFRTLAQVDPVKMVVVDLDDTLWRGVAADSGSAAPTEGWPLGVIEALLYLKKRGIQLAIISKNDENEIRRLWKKMTADEIQMGDFVACKINWLPKVENMETLLKEVNLLPQNVVFVDDNPLERAAMKAAYPQMRILGAYPYFLRRILLWSAETQVAAITEEAQRRTEMLRGQIQREENRQKLSREEFLASLNLEVQLFELDAQNDARFERAFELLNKTNQFNTTGRRWRREELLAQIDAGMRIYIFEVKDRYTFYGIVGVVLRMSNRLLQFIMSCRVLGLGVEQKILEDLCRQMEKEGERQVLGELEETSANMPCRKLYEQKGFVLCNGRWTKNLQAMESKTPAIARQGPEIPASL